MSILHALWLQEYFPESYISFTYQKTRAENYKPSWKMKKLANCQSREPIWKIVLLLEFILSLYILQSNSRISWTYKYMWSYNYICILLILLLLFCSFFILVSMSAVPIVKATANGSLKANQQKELSSFRLIETAQRFGGQSLNQNSFPSVDGGGAI